MKTLYKPVGTMEQRRMNICKHWTKEESERRRAAAAIAQERLMVFLGLVSQPSLEVAV